MRQSPWGLGNPKGGRTRVRDVLATPRDRYNVTAYFEFRSLSATACIPRDQNEEADALTNGDFASFSSGLRVEVDVANVCWLILPRMVEVAGEIYERVRRSKEGEGPPKAATRPKSGSFRQRNPW